MARRRRARRLWVWVVLAGGIGAVLLLVLAFGGLLRTSPDGPTGEHLTESDRQSLERVLEERTRP